MIGDLLFWFQIIMAWCFSIPQIHRSFTTTTGMTITWSMLCSIFVTINFFLALSAYWDSGSRKAMQVTLVYANWLLLWATMFVIISLKGYWTKSDTLVTLLVIASLTVLMIVRSKGSVMETFVEPINRGLMSIIVKSTPQLYIAYCIFKAGRNDGLAGMSLVIGHITVIVRAIEIAVTAKQDGWTKKNIGLFISETGNELTWMVTTWSWLYFNH